MDRNKKGTTAIDQTTDQDVYSPIKESAKVNWPTMLMIFVGMWVSMYSVNVGMAVGQSYSAKPAIIATVLGYAIAGIFAALISDAGQRTGLASYVLAKCPLGSVGQIMIALLMFVTIVWQRWPAGGYRCQVYLSNPSHPSPTRPLCPVSCAL